MNWICRFFIFSMQYLWVNICIILFESNSRIFWCIFLHLIVAFFLYFLFYIARSDYNSWGGGKKIVDYIRNLKNAECQHLAGLKLDCESVAPVANCISDLQTELGLAGGSTANMARKRESVSTRHGGNILSIYPLSVEWSNTTSVHSLARHNLRD